MLLGGLASAEPLLERLGQLQADDFVGCIHSVAVNGRPLNLSSPLNSRGVENTCSRARGFCGATLERGDLCGGLGECLARWPSPAMCRCPGGILAPNCDTALAAVNLADGSFLEARISEQHRRMQLLDALYAGTTAWRAQEDILGPSLASAAASKRLAISFRTVHRNGLLLLAATNNDFTSLEVRKLTLIVG
jgi:protocadherin Fat 4